MTTCLVGKSPQAARQLGDSSDGPLLSVRVSWLPIFRRDDGLRDEPAVGRAAMPTTSRRTIRHSDLSDRLRRHAARSEPDCRAGEATRYIALTAE